MSHCTTCELVRKRDEPDAPIWDTIHRTERFDVAHAYNTSLPGWIVIVARRHVEAIDELTAEEAAELGVLIQAVSKGLREIVKCAKTYVMQFAEEPGHNHVHFHVVPRMADMPEDYRGAKVFHYLGVSDRDKVSESTMESIATQLRMHIT